MIDWSKEEPIITQVALDHNVDPALIKAIRKHENGEPGGVWGEFGLPTAKYPTYLEQLEGCVKTCRTALAYYEGNPLCLEPHKEGFRRLCYTRPFLIALRDRYAPIGAANDPTNLNENWINGVGQFYLEFAEIKV